MTRTMTECARVATGRVAPRNAMSEHTTSKKRTRRRCMTVVALLVSTAVWSGLSAGAAGAASTVNTWDELLSAVGAGGTVDVALGADITGPPATSLVLQIGDDLTLDLNGHTLTVIGGGAEAGVRTTDATLTINATGGGSFTATGGQFGAGIGGGYEAAGGTVTINGGTVTATGGQYGAGIGGGFDAGIGGGNEAAAGTVTVNGGTVTATGGLYGAGIGGGYGAAAGTVTINGGTVTATGGENGAGIGGGQYGGSGPVIVGAGASVMATAGRDSNTVVGNNGGPPDGPVTNSGSLVLNGNQTIYGTFTNTATGVLTVNTRVGGSGTLVNEGTILFASGAYIAGFETHVTVHDYWVSYDLNGQPGATPPGQIVYAASFAAGQLTMPAPPSGMHWLSAPSGGFAVTATTDLPSVFGVNNDPNVDMGATKLTLYAEPPATAPDLAVSLVDSADPVSLGDTYAYTLTVTNDGSQAATGASASLSFAGPSRSLLSATASQGSCSVGASVTCELGTVAAGGTATVTVRVEPNAVGTIAASATASAAEADSNTANNTASQTTTVDNAHGCTIMGTPGDDTINGTNGNDVICALGGNDMVSGRNGNDVIYAGSGNDRSHGETLLGSLLASDFGKDTIYGGPGDDALDGGSGDDTVIDTEGTDTLRGSGGNDTIVTADGAGGDTADGGLGTDTCRTDPNDTRTSC